MNGWAVDRRDVTSRWRPLTPSEEQVIDQLLDDAAALLRSDIARAGFELGEADADRAQHFRRIAAGAVIRVLKNPDGYLEETVDDYRYRYDRSVSSGTLYFTPDEIEQLRPVPRRARGAFSIRPSS